MLVLNSLKGKLRNDHLGSSFGMDQKGPLFKPQFVYLQTQEHFWEAYDLCLVFNSTSYSFLTGHALLLFLIHLTNIHWTGARSFISSGEIMEGKTVPVPTPYKPKITIKQGRESQWPTPVGTGSRSWTLLLLLSITPSRHCDFSSRWHQPQPRLPHLCFPLF